MHAQAATIFKSESLTMATSDEPSCRATCFASTSFMPVPKRHWTPFCTKSRQDLYRKEYNSVLMTMPDKTTLTCKVEQEVADRLDILADKTGMSRSELAAHCLAFGVREGEKFADRLSQPVVGHFLRLMFHLDTDDAEELARFEDMWKSVKKTRSKRPRPTT